MRRLRPVAKVLPVAMVPRIATVWRIATATGLALGAGATAIVALASRAPAQSAGEHIADYKVGMQLRADGNLAVDEQITYDFGSTAHHGIFRDLVERETYDAHHDRRYRISDVTVNADNNSTRVSLSHTGSYLRVRIGDPNVTVSGVHTYTIEYRLEGAARTFADHQELYWDAIGNQWPVRIDRATVTVGVPASITSVACSAGPPGSRLTCARASARGRVATFSQTNLAAGTGLTIFVGLPSGSIVPDPQPILERRRTLADAFAVRANTVIPAIAIGLLTTSYVPWLARRRGRDRRYAGSAVDAAFGNATGAEEPVGIRREDAGPVEFVPPDGVLPGQVGTLVDEHANLVDVTATQAAGKGTLLPYETALMNALFGAGPEVKLSDLKYKFRAELAQIQDAMYDDVVAQGWYRIRPDRTRQRWVLIALGFLAVAIAATVLVALASSFGLVPLGFVLGAITLLAVASHMPSRTGKGSAMFSRVRGFLRLFDEGDQGVREKFAEQHEIFSQYLPYAIVFGCTDKWARVFAQLDAQQLETGWYRGNAPFNAILLASSINHFGTVATGTLYASQPSSSSGRGFGGGFSGGGAGGGGGGSW